MCPNSFKLYRLFLLRSSNFALDVDENGKTSFDRAKERLEERGLRKESVFYSKAVIQEMDLYLENPIRYRSDCSALIQLAIGLASLDWPVLVVTIVSEYLVSINEEKLFGEYSEQKSWDIASLIKKKAKIEN